MYLVVLGVLGGGEGEVKQGDVDALAGADADHPGARLGAEAALRRHHGAQVARRSGHVQLPTRVAQVPDARLNCRQQSQVFFRSVRTCMKRSRFICNLFAQFGINANSSLVWMGLKFESFSKPFFNLRSVVLHT